MLEQFRSEKNKNRVSIPRSSRVAARNVPLKHHLVPLTRYDDIRLQLDKILRIDSALLLFPFRRGGQNTVNLSSYNTTKPS